MAVKQLTAANFDEVVNGSAVPVLIDFYATWCGPCKMLSPIIEEIAGESADKLTVCRVDVDEEGALAARFGISAVPTLIVMKNGEVSNMAAGYMPKSQVLALI
ncbi:MAG: thioredoxin [Butyricicoccus sp.]|nr:thioredoxin [Butyricicoccus sp.]